MFAIWLWVDDQVDWDQVVVCAGTVPDVVQAILKGSRFPECLWQDAIKMTVIDHG